MRLAVIFAALALSAGAAFAADATTGAAGDAAAKGGRWAACSADVQKFCGDIERGKGQMRACLDQHAAELSDGCKQRRAERAAQRQDRQSN